MARAQRERWSIVLLDLDVDTTTPSGEMLASVLATFAQFERRLIGQRTRDALAVKRANGVKLGRPRQLPSSVRADIESMRHDDGMSLSAIAEALNRCNVPTAQGGAQWWPSTVRAILHGSVRV
jgi:DNA invertase Pin-like site-specific DNA recombinase